MNRRAKEYREIARSHRTAGRLTEAAGYYTTAGFSESSRIWRPPEDRPSTATHAILPKSVGKSVKYLLASALCYRLADEMARCRNRCEHGVLMIRDLKDNEPGWFEGMGLNEKSNARSGLAHELIGDFRLYGDLGDREEQYGIARQSTRQYERNTQQRHRKSSGRPNRSLPRP